MNYEGQAQKLSRIYRKTWTEPDYKRALLECPASVLVVEGVTTPQGATLIALENTNTLFNLIIPAKAEGVELSDAQQDGVSRRLAGALLGICF